VRVHSDAVQVMSQPFPGLDDDQVEPDRQRRQRGPVREPSGLAQGEAGPVQPRALAMVDGLLRQAEVTTSAPPDLDDHDRRRRTRIDRDEVNLRVTDMHMHPEDAPAERGEVRGDPSLGTVTGFLGLRSHDGERDTARLSVDHVAVTRIAAP